VPPELEALLASAHNRGFRRWVAIGIGVIGVIPAIAVAAFPRPGTDSAPLIAALVAFGPAALLLVWTVRDRDGQAARELVMWLNSMRRAAARESVDIPLDDLPPTPRGGELGRANLQSQALEYRDALEPLVANRRALAVRIAIYRYWYVVLWLVLSVVFAVAVMTFLRR
jgi:hypothetical protein